MANFAFVLFKKNASFPFHPSVTDDALLTLSTLFDRNAARGLALVDAGAVTAFVGQPSGRRLSVVGAPSGSRHASLPPHHCDCEAFHFDVVARGDAAACKHGVAAAVAAAVEGGEKVESVPDTVLARLLIAG